MAVTVSIASAPADYEDFADLVRAYVRWCRARFQEDVWLIDQVFGEQALERELEDLRASYAPPNGRAFLARDGQQICGGGAYHMLSAEICEMKRLFVPDRYRGKGVGRTLCDALIASAARDGFKFMRLDTMSLMSAAIAMYQSAGFRPCPAYKNYPAEVLPYIRFLEVPLERP